MVGQVYALIDHLSTTTEACPTCGLSGSDRVPLFSTPVGAPYKADLALTYGCNNTCGHCYNQPRRTGMPSLAVDDWYRVLGKLAAVGVPQVIFTGGEPTLFAGLSPTPSPATPPLAVEGKRKTLCRQFNLLE